MIRKKLTCLLAAAAALVLLAVPASAEEPLPADAEEPQQITYVALGDSITAGVGLSDLQYNTAQIGLDLKPNFEGYSSRCYTALVGQELGLDRQHAINLGLPSLMSADMLDIIRTGGMPAMNQASGSYYVYPEYQEYLPTLTKDMLEIAAKAAAMQDISIEIVTDYVWTRYEQLK